jgi:coproporphyrinogen III oxidase
MSFGGAYALARPDKDAGKFAPSNEIEVRKARARQWFEGLRDRIVEIVEQLERDAPEELYPGAPGRFERSPWARAAGGGTDQGGGVMGMMRGRVFEKIGVHTSTVHGVFSPEFAAQVKGAAQSRQFWASGISLICHPRNPHIPPVHMNARMMVTTQSWFGGIADLNPVLSVQRDRSYPDARDFHARLKGVCDSYGPDSYEKFAKWADEYFWLPHRGEPRGIGGIFYDHLDSGDWEKDFSLTRSVGDAFCEIYPAIVRRHISETWNETHRAEQAHWRSRYVEFNLLYDRGTTFGLKTGGNVDSILSSMPPMAAWP